MSPATTAQLPRWGCAEGLTIGEAADFVALVADFDVDGAGFVLAEDGDALGGGVCLPRIEFGGGLAIAQGAADDDLRGDPGEKIGGAGEILVCWPLMRISLRRSGSFSSSHCSVLKPEADMSRARVPPDSSCRTSAMSPAVVRLRPAGG